jgi:hypothetical protein
MPREVYHPIMSAIPLIVNITPIVVRPYMAHLIFAAVSKIVSMQPTIVMRITPQQANQYFFFLMSRKF